MEEFWPTKRELNAKAIVSTTMIALQLSISPNTLLKQSRNTLKKVECDPLVSVVLWPASIQTGVLISTIPILLALSQNGGPKVAVVIPSRCANSWRSTISKG